MVTIGDPWAEVPIMNEPKLQLLASVAVMDMIPGVQIIATKPDGIIIVSLTEEMSAGDRGAYLMSIESVLKDRINPAITVYLQPKMDRNALRHLRGVEVKGWRQE